MSDTEGGKPSRKRIGGSRPLELTPAMFEAAGQHALTWRHLAAVLGVDTGTVANRMKDPEFKQAYERGRMASQNEVIQTLFAHMRQGSLKAAIFLAQAWCHLSTRHEVKTEEVQTRYIVEVPATAPTLDEWSATYRGRDEDGQRLN